MVTHMPWNRNLGGSRVQIELADEFVARGHIVEKFDYFDAFPRGRSRVGNLLAPREFCARARDHVRRNASGFDVIDAHHGNLPFSKADLRYDGLLAARSGGLYFFYRDFERFARQRWPNKSIGRRSTRPLWVWRESRERPTFLRSLETADLVIAQNADEQAYLTNVLGFGRKTILARVGLSEALFLALGSKARGPARLAQAEVVFIGHWGLRKGSADWARIVRRIREDVPRARFAFLGTGCSEERVLEDIELPGEGIRVVPEYESTELPALLESGTVGALPSYIEGFGIGVLELLAAGIPTVTYDVPGPREMLNLLDPSLLTPAGDAEGFGARISALLSLQPEPYTEVAQACLAVAQRFVWKDIATETLQAYDSGLERLRDSRSHGFVTS
jgi:glycosyltransferase involved in cell wall biosynthesis